LKIVIAPDSFKECLSSSAVADAIERGVLRVFPDATIVKVPMADGGEGTVEAVAAATGATIRSSRVTGPLGESVEAHYAVTSGTAVIEMAAASGLHLVPLDKRNPLKTTTYGTGELIKAALDEAVTKIVVGVGGSATVDGGTGMAQALGVRFLDNEGEPLDGCGGNLARIARIDMSGVDPRVRKCAFEVACDVTNRLCGAQGAAHVYGPQKGATPDMVEQLADGLAHLSRIIKRDVGADVARMPGAGAAGGLAAGLVAFLGAQLRSGVELLIETVHLEERLKDADLLITGEGKMDNQTLSGKLPLGVARLASQCSVPTLGVTGAFEGDLQAFLDQGFVSIITTAPGPISIESSLRNASRWIAEATERALYVLKLGLASREKKSRTWSTDGN